MKASLLVLFLLIGLTSSAWARLGETENQLIARYGQELLKTNVKIPGTQLTFDFLQFVKSGYSVQVSLVNGVSSEEEIHKPRNESITDEEAQILLNANSQGHPWVEDTLKTDVPRKWHRDDGATAELFLEILDFKSKALIDARTASQQAVHSPPSLNGF
jgi:hypothetical protein